MITTRRTLAACLLALIAAPAAQAQERPGPVQRTGRALGRGARRSGSALSRGANRTGGALRRAGNWTANRARRARRRITGNA